MIENRKLDYGYIISKVNINITYMVIHYKCMLSIKCWPKL